VFSLTRQAIQLGQFPRMKIIQTSREEFGQIYVPAMNWLLMAATVGLVLGFRSSSNLTSAYGIAVSINMVMTSTLAAIVARRRGWRPLVLGTFTGALLTVDVAFLGANMFKISEGGWYALLAGAFMFLIMDPWRRGRELVAMRLRKATEPLSTFLARVASDELPRVSGTAVFITAEQKDTPPTLLHYLKHHHVLHEQIVLLTVQTERVRGYAWRRG
jgi:KUP system potassium uptake protein